MEKAMALNIKNAETEKLVRELARRRGQGITEALTDVVRREVERERRKPRRSDIEERRRRIEEIVQRVKSYPVLDNRSPDEIIGYNDQGHFD
jgi:antitoxin VapB